MKCIYRKLLTLLVAVFFSFITLNLTSHANADDLISKDIAGQKDPQGLKRIDGAILVLGESKAYDEFTIPLQKIEFDYNLQKFKEWNKISVEGSRDTVFYRLPRDASTLEVLKSYEDDLTASGFELLYKANAPDLDDGYGRFMKEVYGITIGGSLMEYTLPGSSDFRYLAMQKKNEDGTSTYIAGLFSKVADNWGSKYGKPGEVISRLDVIKTKPLKNRLVTVKAEEMPQLLGTSGKVILYGIQFDFNKTEIKPDSNETLAEVAKFLTNNSTARLVVTGHTDNVGTFDFNKDLSQRRAQAVVEYLVSHHGIAKDRLIPFGASFASPIASNQNEDGKSKNRRVELVQF